MNKRYKRVKIKIAFNPIEEKFEVANPAIRKDKHWVPDISSAINGDLFELVDDYFKLNPDVNQKQVRQAFSTLINIPRKQIGLIELSPDLDIETVTEIFIRINSKGVVLSQADFAMSKIASDQHYGGNQLRKAIDYFCHLSSAPEFIKHIIDNDKDFVTSDYFMKMSWLQSESEDLYQPEYNDLLRVAFTSQFNRGKLSDLVSLLSGRNFETRTFESEIAESSFNSLRIGVQNFINQTNYKRFLMIIRSAGFISKKLIRSTNALNFVYILYLTLIEQKVSPVKIESFVRRWFVYSLLTGRYSGSPESTIDFDIKQISSKSIEEYLREKEQGELSDAFWNVSLPQSLDTSVASSPFFHVYLASQIKNNEKGFLSRDLNIADLITHRGDIHHLFPKNYLKKNGLGRSHYNQIANYVFMQSEINIKVGNRPPKEYFNTIIDQIRSNNLQWSGIATEEDLQKNLEMNCIPKEIINMDVTDYRVFLSMRRSLIATKIKEYYFKL